MTDAQRVATEIVKKLVRAGYTAYFAGGWVRDYILGHPNDDIDIATDAPPEKILDLFPRTILVGLAFGIVVVVLDGHQFEVATFRKDLEYKNGRSPTGIQLATAQEDAQRRDFTINGMFYDPIENKIYDFISGQHDLKLGIIKAIGNPHERFFEDRLRMVRAVRFAARFQYVIESETEEAIQENAPSLFPSVAMERIWQEFEKMTAFPHFDRAVLDMQRLGLLEVIFPSLKNIHLSDLRKWIEPFDRFPKNTPTIIYLLSLFPHGTLDDWQHVCRLLKTSQKEIKLAEFFMQGQQLWGENPTQVDNLVAAVHFYAHPDAQLYLDVAEVKLPSGERPTFHQFHLNLQQKLKPHIERSRQKKPLVNAALLKESGVQPGPGMGRLLALAEQYVILNDLHNPAKVVRLLKQSSAWPTNIG